MTHQTIDFPHLVHMSGRRLTAQRQIILDTLCEMGGHVSVSALYERVHGRFPAINRSTVYRALDFFLELGLVSAVEVGGAAVFEIAPDGRHHPHNHLVCRDCGDIVHVPDDAFTTFAARLRDEIGFAADADKLTILGVCRDCYTDK